MAGSRASDQSQAAALERLEKQLAALGSETRGQRAAKRVVPWVISIAIHLAIAVIAVFITWTVANLPAEEESALIVADFNALQYEPVAPLQDQVEQTVQQEPTPAVLDLAPPAPSAANILDQLRPADADPLAQFADFGNSGAEAATGLVAFAPSGEASASFAGTSATNARNIVYLIDATGSMVAHLKFVIDQLSLSLSNLSDQQSFSIIFFQGDGAVEVPPAGRLTPASAKSRDDALAWISANIIPREKTNPLPAIERALRQQPDVVFMLSHGITGYGQFEIDQRDLMEQLDRMNPIDPRTGRRATQINCIQFLEDDPLDTMRLIAQEHGGANGYKFLSRRDLGLGDK